MSQWWLQLQQTHNQRCQVHHQNDCTRHENWRLIEGESSRFSITGIIIRLVFLCYLQSTYQTTLSNRRKTKKMQKGEREIERIKKESQMQMQICQLYWWCNLLLMQKKSVVKKKRKNQTKTKTKIKTSLEEKVYYDVSMNEQNFETFFLSYKIKYFQSSVTSIILFLKKNCNKIQMGSC